MLHVNAIMRSGDWANYFLVGSTTSALLTETQNRFDQQGLRLVSIEFESSQSQPRWLAIYRSGDWAHRLTVGRDIATFLKETQTFFDKEGLRLEHMATYIVGGQRLWAGSYRSGDWAHRLTIGRDTITFLTESQKFFDTDGLRITQMVPYYDNNKLQWAAIYTSGDWASRLTIDRQRDTFLQESQQFFDKEGFRVTSLVRYIDGGQTKWGGIYRIGSWASWLMFNRPLPHFIDEAQSKFDQNGLRLIHASIVEAPATVIRLHMKVLTTPTIPINQMIEAMREVYTPQGFVVEVASTETLNFPLLDDLDVGGCTSGSTTNEQNMLFANRNNVGNNELTIYFCRSVGTASDSNAFNGCASHPTGQPGAAVASYATRWTLAHEVGHVLGLSHCDTTTSRLFNRLMTGGGTNRITNPPPDLIQTEVTIMSNSALTVPA